MKVGTQYKCRILRLLQQSSVFVLEISKAKMCIGHFFYQTGKKTINNGHFFSLTLKAQLDRNESFLACGVF